MSKVVLKIEIEDGTNSHDVSKVLRELEESGYSITLKTFGGFVGTKDIGAPIKFPEEPEPEEPKKLKRPYKKGKGKFNKVEYQREYRKRKAEEKKNDSELGGDEISQEKQEKMQKLDNGIKQVQEEQEKMYGKERP